MFLPFYLKRKSLDCITQLPNHVLMQNFSFHIHTFHFGNICAFHAATKYYTFLYNLTSNQQRSLRIYTFQISKAIALKNFPTSEDHDV